MKVELDTFPVAAPDPHGQSLRGQNHSLSASSGREEVRGMSLLWGSSLLHESEVLLAGLVVDNVGQFFSFHLFITAQKSTQIFTEKGLARLRNSRILLSLFTPEPEFSRILFKAQWKQKGCLEKWIKRKQNRNLLNLPNSFPPNPMSCTIYIQ